MSAETPTKVWNADEPLVIGVVNLRGGVVVSVETILGSLVDERLGAL
jgi:hypothetical protein